MYFDFKRVTLGNLLSITTIISSIFIAYLNIKTDVNVIKNDIAWIKHVLQVEEKKLLTNNQ